MPHSDHAQSIHSAKTHTRKALLQQRRALSRPQVERLSQACIERVIENAQLFKYRRIGLYYPIGNECDVLALIKHPRLARAEFYLPVVLPFTRHLRFARFGGNEQGLSRANRYRIPSPSIHHSMSVRRLDALLMPLVGFDAQGARIGMGGGYYDCSLSTVDVLGCAPKKWGVGYDFQQVAKIASAPWDVMLDGIYTNEGYVSGI